MIAGPHIFVSGQLPADAEGNIVQGSIAEQTTACCENLKNILAEAGSDITRVVKASLNCTALRRPTCGTGRCTASFVPHSWPCATREHYLISRNRYAGMGLELTSLAR